MTTLTKEQTTTATAVNNGFSLISDEKLLQLYSSMVKCRGVHERALLAGKVEAALGQEAAVTGVAIDLLAEDTVALSPRDTLVRFMQGEPLGAIFKRIFGRVAGSSLAVQIKKATRAAQENNKKKNGKIAVVFSHGDSGFPLETLKLAAVERLPILFVSLNSPAAFDALPAQECDIPSIPVDGNDVVAVYRVSTEAIAHARKGNGPTLIECILDGSDPILKMEEYLKRKSLFSEGMKREVMASFARELETAVSVGIQLRNP
jgi:TPP-dependent pyruvate/acetoin dehydrogenase alpha subunit